MTGGIEHVHLSAGIYAVHLRISGDGTGVIDINKMQRARRRKAFEQAPAARAELALGVVEDEILAGGHLFELYRRELK